jgi:hypothetical protein
MTSPWWAWPRQLDRNNPSLDIRETREEEKAEEQEEGKVRRPQLLSTW